MDNISLWLQWMLALMRTTLQFLGSIKILGVSLSWLMVASFLIYFICSQVFLKDDGDE